MHQDWWTAKQSKPRATSPAMQSFLPPFLARTHSYTQPNESIPPRQKLRMQLLCVGCCCCCCCCIYFQRHNKASSEMWRCSPIHNRKSFTSAVGGRGMTCCFDSWVCFLLSGESLIIPTDDDAKDDATRPRGEGWGVADHAHPQRVCCLRRSGFCFCLCFARDAAPAAAAAYFWLLSLAVGWLMYLLEREYMRENFVWSMYRYVLWVDASFRVSIVWAVVEEGSVEFVFSNSNFEQWFWESFSYTKSNTSNL